MTWGVNYRHVMHEINRHVKPNFMVMFSDPLDRCRRRQEAWLVPGLHPESQEPPNISNHGHLFRVTTENNSIATLRCFTKPSPLTSSQFELLSLSIYMRLRRKIQQWPLVLLLTIILWLLPFFTPFWYDCGTQSPWAFLSVEKFLWSSK